MRGTIGFILGFAAGAFACMVVFILVPASTREATILDLRAQVAEQRRELEAVRRELARQTAVAPAVPVVHIESVTPPRRSAKPAATPRFEAPFDTTP